MLGVFNAYSELLCIDTTYKLLQLGLLLYLMLCEDSNGQSEIVASCPLVTEDTEGITWMIDTFKKLNSKWRNTRVAMD